MAKKILVTGSTSGLGKGIISKFHSEGWQVCVNGRSDVKVDSVVSDFNNKRAKSAIGIASDFGTLDERLKVYKKILNNYRSIDVIIFNVGSGVGTKGIGSSFQENLKLMEINYLNTIKSFDLFLELLNSNEGASVVFIGSIAASKNVGAPFSYAYSKKALNLFSKYQTLKLISQKINVHSLNPGHILTENGVWGKLKSKSGKEFDEFVKKNIPTEKIGEVQEVSEFVYNLIEKQNSYFIPGEPLRLDGGASLLF